MSTMVSKINEGLKHLLIALMDRLHCDYSVGLVSCLCPLGGSCSVSYNFFHLVDQCTLIIQLLALLMLP